MNKLQFIIMHKLGKSPKKTYEKEVALAYMQHGMKANRNGFDAVVKMLKGAGTDWKLAFEQGYNSTPYSDDLKKIVKRNTEAYYIYNKQIKRRKMKKADMNYTLNMKDKKAIQILSKSDLLWIKNHATKTQVSTFIEKLITTGLENYLSGDAIAESLTGMIADLGENWYIEKFGEQAYWEMVTNTNMVRISSFGDLNTFAEAEIQQYRIDTRGELACEICAPYQGKIYDVSAAVSKMDNYLEYGRKEDVEGMKKIYTFGAANIDGSGETPPFHPNCYCELIAIID